MPEGNADGDTSGWIDDTTDAPTPFGTELAGIVTVDSVPGRSAEPVVSRVAVPEVGMITSTATVPSGASLGIVGTSGITEAAGATGVSTTGSERSEKFVTATVSDLGIPVAVCVTVTVTVAAPAEVAVYVVDVSVEGLTEPFAVELQATVKPFVMAVPPLSEPLAVTEIMVVPFTCTDAVSKLATAEPNAAAGVSGIVTEAAAKPVTAFEPPDDENTLQTYSLPAVSPVTLTVFAAIPDTVAETVPPVATQSIA